MRKKPRASYLRLHKHTRGQHFAQSRGLQWHVAPQHNLAGKVKLKLYDAKGRAVRVAVFEQNGQLVLNGLPAGIYTCAVESELAMWFGKVVVE